MKKFRSLLLPSLCLAAACAQPPVELGYGTDSLALSDSEETGGAMTDDGCPCPTAFESCTGSGDLQSCREELHRCVAEDPRCSATADLPGDPSITLSPCRARYLACYESGEPADACNEMYGSCSEAMSAADEHDPPPAMQTDACGARYQGCRESGQPGERCAEVYRSCSEAVRGMERASAATPEPATPEMR